jgi:hypothetical protein
MGDDSKLKNSKMLAGDASLLSNDEEIAVHVMHHFNIDLDTLESMPAFDKPLRSLLWAEKKQ